MKKIIAMILLGLIFGLNSTASAEEVARPMEQFSAQLIDQLQKGCKTELEVYCKNVTPGEGRVVACIYAHNDKISAQCEKSLYNSAQEFEVAGMMMNTFVESCQPDIEKLCSTVAVGEGRILKCLEENKGKVSARCNEVRQQAKSGLESKPDVT